MAIVLLVCITVTAVVAAPTSEGVYRDWQQELYDRMEQNKLQELYPAKRSNYGSLYVSPCAAAASAQMTAYAPAAAPIPAYGPVPTPYSYSHAAYQTAPAHPGYAPSHYGHSYYRTEDELEGQQEMLEFSDGSHPTLDHVPMARYSYGATPTGGASTVQTASGPVVGVFSNANVGGCSVPLLVSCSPSIAQGRVVKSQPYYASGSSGQQDYTYRVDEQSPHDESRMHQEMQHSSEHSLHNSEPIGDKHQ